MKRHVLAMLGLVFLPLPAHAAAPVVLTDGSAGDWFGDAVDMQNNLLVVGAPRADVGSQADRGKVYLYERRGGQWEQTGVLVAPDGNAGALFGDSISLSGKLLVVGAPHADISGFSDTGAAYVFEKRGGRWVMTTKLSGEEAVTGGNFGFSVGTDGRSIIIGAPDELAANGQFSNGNAYIFERRGRQWMQVERLKTSYLGEETRYGYAVDISSNMAVVGDPNYQESSGTFFVYGRTRAGWNEIYRSPGGVSHAKELGRAVAISHRELAVSEPWMDTDETYLSGTVRTYRTQRDHLTGLETLTPEDWYTLGEFGMTLDTTANRLAVGGHHDAYAFVRHGDDWQEIFGVSLPGSTVSDPPATPDVAISGRLLAAGDPLADPGSNNDQGAVYLYALSR